MERCVFECRTRNTCYALEEKHCEGCGFRKTKEEYRDGKIAAMTRLKSLPNYEYYYKKYYAERGTEC